MLKEFPMLSVLEIETSSYCNRSCPSCIRNSDPDKDRILDWAIQNYLPTEYILEIVKQAYEMGFDYKINLSHYNEPLLDKRMASLCRDIKKIGNFTDVAFHSNGDFITEELAEELDGAPDRIAFTLYGPDEIIKERQEWISSLFKETKLDFLDKHHIPTHNSPIFDVATLAKQHINNICVEPQIRFIFNHRGEMLLCCEEMVSVFNLGRFPDKSVEELWYNAQQYIDVLKTKGGRKQFSLCKTCPRP